MQESRKARDQLEAIKVGYQRGRVHIEQNIEDRSKVAKPLDLMKVEPPPKVNSVVTKQVSPTEIAEDHLVQRGVERLLASR